MAATFRTYLELVRFSHTVFAMPFAIMAAMIALHFGGDPVWQSQPWQWVQSVIGVLLCMVSARTAAMAFNRLVDRTIDAVNPRTASRHLPRGDLQTGEVLCLIVAASVAFVASTLLFLPNWLPLVLSVPVLAWLLGYSYAKRFTMWAMDGWECGTHHSDSFSWTVRPFRAIDQKQLQPTARFQSPHWHSKKPR